jgi:hypothetical protein
MPKPTILRRPNAQPGDTIADPVERIRNHIRATRLRPDNAMPLRYRWLWSLMLSDQTPLAKLLGVSIWLHTDPSGGNAFPAQSTLAAMTGVEPRSLRRSTRQLERAGFLDTQPGSGERSTRYEIRIPQQTLIELAALRGDPGVRTEGTVESGQGGPQSPDREDRRVPRSTPLTNALNQRTEPTQGSEPAAPSRRKKPRSGILGEIAAEDGARKFALGLKSLDCNEILSGELFQPSAYAELAAMIEKFGTGSVRAAVTGALARDRAGNPMRRGHVRTWSYFRRQIEEEGDADVAETV